MGNASQGKVIDLFSGVGGLTHGFVLEGFDVVAGIDIDDSCRYAFESNNGSRFIRKDIAEVTAEELRELYGDESLKILIACAPCQPFSTLNLNRAVYQKSSEKWASLSYLVRLITKVQPEVVSMENVPELADRKKFPIFGRFVRALKGNRYHVSYSVVDASKYGVPQRRKRLILLASRLGPISLLAETHPDHPVTVRQSIGDLPPIRDGETSPSDMLHRASRLSDLNRKRIRATPKDGGSASSWDRELLPKCFKDKRGESYKCTVYGRMKWDEPAPTMTTQCSTLGTGRFGHPSQNRAISLREAARFQTFPDDYEFDRPDNVQASRVAKHIGNAVPVRLGQIIAMSIKNHINEFNYGKTK
jgi:DNA (cytosine-5)-methyltransferase 1